MPSRQTPLEVMFSLFKTSFALSHRALAELLLSDRPLTNGRPTAQMAQDTSWLSRTIVHSQPGSLEDRYFADWSCASNRILHKLREKGYSNADIYTAIASATGAIVQTLSAYGRDGLLYRNAASRLVGCQSDEELSCRRMKCSKSGPSRSRNAAPHKGRCVRTPYFQTNPAKWGISHCKSAF